MKTSGTYKTLVKGVSQQAPQDRFPGQMSEQVNMIPDPVQGLGRRHGSVFKAERLLGAGWTGTQRTDSVADSASWTTFDYTYGGKEYTICLRRAARPTNSQLPAVLVYNHTDSQFLTVTRPVSDTLLDQLEAGGASAITAIGKYVFLAGNTIVPAQTTSNKWADATNQASAAVWVRGGANGRTFKVVATKTDNTQVTLTHTTPASSYQGQLDTSKIPLYAADPAGGTQSDTEACWIKDVAGTPTAELLWGDWNTSALTAKKGSTAMTNVHPAAPASSTEFRWAAGDKVVTFHSSNIGALDVSVTYTHTKTITNPSYATLVQGLTEDYNSAVTAWIGSAATAIQPESIAAALHAQAVTAGISGGAVIGSTVILSGVKEVVCFDSGDGTLLRGVANQVTAADLVTPVHRVGQVVKVKPRKTDETFYLRAIPKDSAVTSGFAEVSWVEGVGVEQTITGALIYGVAQGSNFYMASTAAGLTAAGATGTHPVYEPSTCGDTDSVNAPFFIGRKITYLGVFQDRLGVGAGSVVRFSRIGDYLNFYRTTMLSAPADDTVELSSQGNEDDELQYSVIYDRDLVIFGKKRQYTISGRAPLTPSNPVMPVMSSHRDAALLQPLAVGDLIFYAKSGALASSVFQIQPGQVAESPQSYPASPQIDKYLLGQPIELASVAQPATLFLRTTGARSSVYCFTFLDTQQGRQQDAWHRFDYRSELGVTLGMTPRDDGLMVFFLRQGDGGDYVVADQQPLTVGLSEYPYLDSHRPWSTVNLGTGSVRPTTSGDWSIAYDASTEYQFIGKPLAQAASLFTEVPGGAGPRVGFDFQAYFVPTNPYVRDNQDRPILTGRLTVTKLGLAYDDSSGFIAEVTSNGVVEVTTDTVDLVVTEVLDALTPSVDTATFNGFVAGDPSALVGRVPITTGIKSVPVAKETRDYVILIKARKWLPLTVTSLDWVGQFFNRTQRVN